MHKHGRLPKKAVPLVILGLFIQIFAFIDIMRSSVFLRGNKAFWLAMVFVVPPLGPLAYYVFGREAF